MDIARMAAAVTCVVAWAALGLQFGLLYGATVRDGGSIGFAAWRFFGYFTILTNLGVALVAGAMALRPQGALAAPRARLAAVTCIAVVGIVYSVALRNIWNPTGWQAVADHALHDATPLLFTATWLLAAHGRLAWRDALYAVAPGVAYCLYALARGAADGWYAYWFLNPTASSLPELIRNIVLLAAGFLAVAALFVGLDRWLARRTALQ